MMTNEKITFLKTKTSQPNPEFLQLLRATAEAARRMCEAVDRIDRLLEERSTTGACGDAGAVLDLSALLR